MSSSRRPWFPWYPADFNQDEKVRMLSDDAELLYRRVLDVLWQANDLQLPSNCQKLAKALARNWSSERFESAWSEIQTPGFELLKTTDDGDWIYSKRLKLEAERFLKLSQERSIIGKKGAKAKTKQLPSKSLAKAQARVKQSVSQPQPQPQSHINKKNIKKSYNYSNGSILKSYPYPEWLNTDLWQEFVSMRSKSKHPITSKTAISRLLTSLKAIMDQGHSQEDIIGLSLERNWRGFFTPSTTIHNGVSMTADEAKRAAMIEQWRIEDEQQGKN